MRPRSAEPSGNMPPGPGGGRNQFVAPMSDPPSPCPFACAGGCDAQRPRGPMQLGLVMQNLARTCNPPQPTHTMGPIPFFLLPRASEEPIQLGHPSAMQSRVWQNFTPGALGKIPKAGGYPERPISHDALGRGGSKSCVFRKRAIVRCCACCALLGTALLWN